MSERLKVVDVFGDVGRMAHASPPMSARAGVNSS
jgi:hypothetical protein